MKRWVGLLLCFPVVLALAQSAPSLPEEDMGELSTPAEDPIPDPDPLAVVPWMPDDKSTQGHSALCPDSPQKAMDRFRAGWQSADVNAIAGVYTWSGVSAREAAETLNAWALMLADPVAGVDVVRPEPAWEERSVEDPSALEPGTIVIAIDEAPVRRAASPWIRVTQPTTLGERVLSVRLSKQKGLDCWLFSGLRVVSQPDPDDQSPPSVDSGQGDETIEDQVSASGSPEAAEQSSDAPPEAEIIAAPTDQF